MAKQLEVSLYRNADSLEAYMNMTTLRSRLQEIAQQVSKRTNSHGSSSGNGLDGNDGGADNIGNIDNSRNDSMDGPSRNGASNRYNFAWQTENDVQHRRNMIQRM
jgi:hypothetical protein